MTLSISVAELHAHNACHLADRERAIRAHLGREVGDNEPIPLTTWAQCPWVETDEYGAETHHGEHSTEDLLWALRCCWHRGGRKVGVEVACRAAERVLHLAREEHRRVLRTAIAAARGHVAGDVSCEAVVAARADAWADACAASYANACAALWAAASTGGDAEWAAIRSDLLSAVSKAVP